MTEEELQTTGVLTTAITNLEEDDMTIEEMLEEFLENLEFMNIPSVKKKQLRDLSNLVKREKDSSKKEELFQSLCKIANEDRED